MSAAVPSVSPKEGNNGLGGDVASADSKSYLQFLLINDHEIHLSRIFFRINPLFPQTVASWFGIWRIFHQSCPAHYWNGMYVYLFQLGESLCGNIRLYVHIGIRSAHLWHSGLPKEVHSPASPDCCGKHLPQRLPS